MSSAERILRELGVRPIDGFTCEELEQRLGIKHQTASAALTKLTNEGKVKPTAVVRQTTSRREAAVYVRIEARKPYLRTATG